MRISLELDDVGSLPCVVTSLEDETATLVGTEATDPHLSGQLRISRRGYLLFSDSNAIIGLRGAARMTPDTEPLIQFTPDEAEQPLAPRGLTTPQAAW